MLAFATVLGLTFVKRTPWSRYVVIQLQGVCCGRLWGLPPLRINLGLEPGYLIQRPRAGHALGKHSSHVPSILLHLGSLLGGRMAGQSQTLPAWPYPFWLLLVPPSGTHCRADSRTNREISRYALQLCNCGFQPQREGGVGWGEGISHAWSDMLGKASLLLTATKHHSQLHLPSVQHRSRQSI